MAVRTVAYLGMSAALTLAVLCGVAVPGVAHAQMLKCENDWLYDYDEMALRAAALRMLPKSVHLVVTGACRNPDWSYGFIETRKNVTPEGVQQWYEFTCRRQRQQWKCDPPEFKQLIALSVVVSSVSHQVELSFDKESSLERARILAARAIEVYFDATSRLPSCGVSRFEEGYLLRTQSSQSPLPSGEKAIRIKVSNEAKDSVTFDDVNVSIDFRRNDTAAGYEAVCWWQLVVVT
jgi:hypothetical protein